MLAAQLLGSVADGDSHSPCQRTLQALLATARARVDERGARWDGLNTSSVWVDAHFGPRLEELLSMALALWNEGGACEEERDLALRGLTMKGAATGKIAVGTTGTARLINQQGDGPDAERAMRAAMEVRARA